MNIVDNRYRWGSCTVKDHVNFNWQLIKGKRQAERRSAASRDPFCFAHAAGVISAIWRLVIVGSLVRTSLW